MSRPRSLTRAALKAFPLPKVEDGDKNSHGVLLIVAGNRLVPGSAMLATRAALRSGTGKVRVATVASVAPSMALHMPEVLVLPIAESSDGNIKRAAVRQVGGEADKADAIVAGPGIEESKVGTAMSEALLRTGKPIVLDAGLLNCLAPIADHCRKAQTPPVLLPHSREMAALLGCEPEEVDADPLAAGHRAAERFGAYVLVKGVPSFVVAPDGRSWKFTGGSPGLGVAGSGDTLSGIVGALIARGMDPLGGLLWAVLLHGEAGARLSKTVGPVGFYASEIPDQLPALLAR
ncbi:NAD(P)H-hydrate dehydratase [Sphingomonas sabuli]|uniref:ADP-dependent (S)-NAD(P)H-hydrate dehydratase n=1 Tax=Sphingomonas sabuli TaxID=2764186 RepID=A0A7G9L124_9SPHN|nr:NAD(P)H-hydrate dehydratase [Sphingomonas sabuli]QNM82323.1 NAD(P)H-hydrate dehydratase [Sphingomonas sabuli]